MLSSLMETDRRIVLHEKDIPTGMLTALFICHRNKRISRAVVGPRWG
jgi:hypothetical protein